MRNPLPPFDHTAVRRAFEKRRWHLEASKAPERRYLQARLQELERGDLSRNLTLTLKSGGGQGESPAGPEALRRRITMLGAGPIMLGMRHSNRQDLKDLDPQLFQSYLAYLLGDYVWNLVARGQEVQR